MFALTARRNTKSQILRLNFREPEVSSYRKEDVVNRSVWGVLLIVGAAACGPGGIDTGGSPARRDGPPIRQPGDSYLTYYADDTGIRVRDARANVDSVLVSGATDVQSKPSPNGAYVGISYVRGDSSFMVMIDGQSGVVHPVHAGVRGTFTYAWAPGSDAIGVGYRPSSGRSAVLIVDTQGSVRNVGCSASNQFLAWRANGQVVVANSANVYTVRASNCATLETLPKRGKTQITYSHDGTRVVFERGGQLILASHNGANANPITNSQSGARNLVWSPSSRTLAFDLNSPRYRSVRHIGMFDVRRSQATFDGSEKPLGMPVDTNPCWSPSGSRLAFDRAYQRSGLGGDSYLQVERVVETFPGGQEATVSEELVRGRQVASDCLWADDDHIVAVTPDGVKIINVTDNVAYQMPEGAKVLYARVLR